MAGREMSLLASGIAVRYSNGNIGLRDANIEIPLGSLLVLMGPNGSGKTSLIRVLTGVIRPATGSVTIGGRAAKADYEHKRQVLVMPQTLPTTAWMLTPRELMLNMAALHGMGVAEAKRRTSEAIDFFELTRIQDQLLFRLSGGQARVCFLVACTLGRGPYLLLDEPTTSLDPMMKDRVWKYLERLQSELGWGVLVTSHQLDELEGVVDNLIFLKGGKSVWQGKVKDIWHRLGNWMILETDVVAAPPFGWRELDSRIMTRRRYLVPDSAATEAIEWSRANGGYACRLSSLDLKEVYRFLLSEGNEREANHRAVVDV
jgi:ABC-type multidrug transport system ATPase subunit